MKMIRNSAFLIGMLVAVPAMGFAQTAPAKAPAAKTATKAAPAKAAKAAKAAVSATKGVVKSMDATSLVITAAGKDMTFVVNAATQKTGTAAVGSNVQVRYTTEGKVMTATAVSVQAAAKKK